ncbi:hypothetical protein EV421DRAFT_1912219 [Armillaria borealis]|uniref:Uncharacterized protein n=1 Tax=Armillaria borealis TaxID=47425 RepID=A0AA39MEP5_9AGAR|nr:hypothetical protein EV421DRAFT_1912219 [Armillaria borealis]
MTTALLMETILLLLSSTPFISMLSEMNIGKAQNRRSSSRSSSVVGYEPTWTEGTQETTSVLGEVRVGGCARLLDFRAIYALSGRSEALRSKQIPPRSRLSISTSDVYGTSTFPEPFVGIEIVPKRRHVHPSSNLPSRIVALPCWFASVEVVEMHEDEYVVWEINCKIVRVMTDAEDVEYRGTGDGDACVVARSGCGDEVDRTLTSLFLPCKSPVFGTETERMWDCRFVPRVDFSPQAMGTGHIACEPVESRIPRPFQARSGSAALACRETFDPVYVTFLDNTVSAWKGRVALFPGVCRDIGKTGGATVPSASGINNVTRQPIGIGGDQETVPTMDILAQITAQHAVVPRQWSRDVNVSHAQKSSVEYVWKAWRWRYDDQGAFVVAKIDFG